MTTNSTTAADQPPVLAIVFYALLGSSSAIVFMLYALCLPFLASHAGPLEIMGAFAIFGAIWIVISNSLPQGVFCPLMDIGIGSVFATLLGGVLTYMVPNILMIGVTMFFSLVAAVLWALSAFGLWIYAGDEIAGRAKTSASR